MPFPNFRNKHGQDSLVTPRDYLAYVRSRGMVPKVRPDALIIAYHRSLMRYVLENHRTRRVKGFFREMFLLGETGNRVAIVGDFGIGAPQAVIYLEEFIEWGVRRFISIGTAGSLQKRRSGISAALLVGGPAPERSSYPAGAALLVVSQPNQVF